MTDAIHRAKPIGRLTKVLTLAPVAIASCLATVAVLTTPVAVASRVPAPKPLPGGQVIPSLPIQNQATLTPKGQVAPAVANNAVDAVVSEAMTGGIPTVALDAYQRAAEVINASDPSCNMPWQLIAAIGRVESDHGQVDGNHLTVSGEAVPGIYGPVLDGKNGTALVLDTDGGALDHNTTYDRAVGPMQFLPSTWAVVGVDATGNGKRDPQNINDAALAAAVYLCSGHSDLSNPADQQAAVFRYNHSTDYVNLVLRIMQAYEAGNYSSIPVGSYAAAGGTTAAALPKATPTKAAKKSGSHAKSGPTATATTPAASSSPSPSSSPTPTSPVNPIQSFLNGLTGAGKSTPTPAGPSTPMTSSQAQTYCNDHLTGIDLFGLEHIACTKKLTGMTPNQAAAGWQANAANLPAWFKSA